MLIFHFKVNLLHYLVHLFKVIANCIIGLIFLNLLLIIHHFLIMHHYTLHFLILFTQVPLLIILFLTHNVTYCKVPYTYR
jgi:hypothetical protein